MDLWSTADVWADEEHLEDGAPPTMFGAIVMWFTVLVPYIGLAALMAWMIFVRQDWLVLGLFAASYLAIGFGVTIGYHRLLAHRAFTGYRWLEAIVLVLGCMAMQGPPVRWTATHRRHHQKSDHDGDPHSPHLHGQGAGAVLLGLWHAHTGWLLSRDLHRTDRSVKDLLQDPMIRRIDRLYPLWLAISWVVPFAIGLAVRGSVVSGLICVLFAVIIRITLMHHATWSVNSICHFFGYRSYQSGDHSRNNPLIAVLSLGEGWHNNHHAFPTSAKHGLRWWEVDVSWMVIRTLEFLGLVWDVRRPTPSAMDQKKLKQTDFVPA